MTELMNENRHDSGERKMVEWDRHHDSMYMHDYTNGVNLQHAQSEKWIVVPLLCTMNQSAVCINENKWNLKNTTDMIKWIDTLINKRILGCLDEIKTYIDG